jgi:hypothetical protein
MTSQPKASDEISQACFGVCCPNHRDCARYHAVEASPAGGTIATCDAGRGQFPAFVLVKAAR